MGRFGVPATILSDNGSCFMGRVTTGSRWTGGPRPSLGTSCSVSTGSPANSVDGQNCRSSGPLPADDVISCKFAIPHLAGHTPQPTPRRFPHASDPHTGHILTQPQSDYAPAETSVRLTRIKRQPAHSNPLGGMGVSVDCGVDDDDDRRGRCCMYDRA